MAVQTISPAEALAEVDKLIEQWRVTVEALEEAIASDDPSNAPLAVTRHLEWLKNYIELDGAGSCFEIAHLDREATELRTIMKALQS